MERRTLLKPAANGLDVQDLRKNATSLRIAHLAIKNTSFPWFQLENFALVGLIMLIYYLLFMGQLNSADF